MFLFGGASVDDREIEERFVRAIGTDGQNRRHQATAVELRLNLRTAALPLEARRRLIQLGGRNVTKDGVLRIVSRKYRSQARNRAEARRALRALLQQAFESPRGSTL